jgi:hypothetical protein
MTTLEIILGIVVVLLSTLIVLNKRWNIRELQELNNSYNIIWKENIKDKNSLHFLLDLLSHFPVSIIEGRLKKDAFELKKTGLTSNKVKIEGKWTQVPGELNFYSSKEDIYIPISKIQEFRDKGNIVNASDLILSGSVY